MFRTAAGVGFQLVATNVRHHRGTEVIAAAGAAVGATATLISTAVVWAAGNAVRDHIYDVKLNDDNNEKTTD